VPGPAGSRVRTSAPNNESSRRDAAAAAAASPWPPPLPTNPDRAGIAPPDPATATAEAPSPDDVGPGGARASPRVLGASEPALGIPSRACSAPAIEKEEAPLKLGAASRIDVGVSCSQVLARATRRAAVVSYALLAAATAPQGLTETARHVVQRNFLTLAASYIAI